MQKIYIHRKKKTDYPRVRKLFREESNHYFVPRASVSAHVKMATDNSCPCYEVPRNDGFVELALPAERESAVFRPYHRMPEVNDSNRAPENYVAAYTGEYVSSDSCNVPKTVDVSELQREMLSLKHQMDLKDSMMDVMMRKVNSLAFRYSNLNGCCRSQIIEHCHHTPDIGQELPYFEGIETQRAAHEWIRKLIEIKEQKFWSNEYTLEMATFYLIGEALTWAEHIDAASWSQFQDEFMKNYVYKDQTEQVTIDKIGKFLGYRNTHLVEMSQRKVITDFDGKLEPVNLFAKFMDQEEAEKKREEALKLQRLPEIVVNERMSMYLLIRSPVVKMREISQLKMEDAVHQMKKQTTRLPASYFLVPESDNDGGGPFSKCSKVINKLLINEICRPGHRNSWSEWWMHVFLEDRITSRKPGLLNSKPIIVNKQSMKAIVDLGVENSMIQYTAAVKNGLDIVSATKSVSVWNDYNKSMVKSLGYVDARICIQPFSLHGKAKLWVVPDGSQPLEVIIGENLLRSPIIYRDEEVGKEEQSDWLDLEDLVFEKTSQLQEKYKNC